jgi:branched-chain amino acid transport system substrate-binding protein
MSRKSTRSSHLFDLAIILAVSGILSVSSASAAIPQQTTDAYPQALSLFREGRYARAADVLQTALEAGGLGASRASAWLLLAAAQLGLDAPRLAITALDGLEREYPDGPYVLERRWLRGRAHTRAGSYFEAAQLYRGLAEDDPEGAIGRAARDALAALVTGPMSDADLQRLGLEMTGSDLKAWLIAVAAEALAERGDLTRARRLLERVESEAPVGGYGEDAADLVRNLTERFNRAGPGGFVLGVLAPLTGPEEDYSREVVDAVRLAIGGSGLDVRYVVRNTDGSFSGTIRGTLALIEEEGAHIILGPVVEELALVAAGIAEAMDVPILLPYTQGADAPSLGENVFQLQATPRLQGRALADAAIDSLGLLTFAVLNSVTGNGPYFADAFMSRVDEKGGNVIAHEVYFPEATDFTVQLEAIRRAGLVMSLADTSNIPLDDEYEIEAANYDTTGALIPVGSIDALVVPGLDATNVSSIAIQTEFNNLVTTILGGPAWNSYTVLSQGRNYVEGTIFTDAFSIGLTSMHQIDFSNRFYAAYGRQPGRTATFAFDATQLALNAWQMASESSPDRRRSLRTWLTGVESYEGASGPVNLTRNGRVNDNVFLLQIADGAIRPYARIEPPELP